MTHETQKPPDEQPYFTVRVTRCGECPNSYKSTCLVGGIRHRQVHQENIDGLTPSCPMWAQRVEPPKD